MIGFAWGLTLLCGFMGFTKFVSKKEEDATGQEVYYRLLSIFAKNKYGYHTRFMNDFDLFLEAVLNERFIEDSTLYYDDEVVCSEIEDQEAGLVNDHSNADMRHLLHDKPDGHHERFKSTRQPDRVGTNYEKGDQLSCYKILPKKMH